MPEAVFGEAVLPPVSDGSGQDRALLGQAYKLLQAAGDLAITLREGAVRLGTPLCEPVRLVDHDHVEVLIGVSHVVRREHLGAAQRRSLAEHLGDGLAQ